MLVTFDFDNTLTVSRWDEEEETFVHVGPNLVMIQCLKAHLEMGNKVMVVTSRHQKHEDNPPAFNDSPRVKQFLEEQGVLQSISGIHFTNGDWKAPLLDALDSARHHDDDQEELSRLPARCEGIFVPNGWQNLKEDV